VSGPRETAATTAIRVGTSGFIYDHWRDRFYTPSDRGSELERYATAFDTVELNVTFYRMPPSSTFRSWARRVPDDFIFAVKASRYLTHVKRLQDSRSSVELLVDRARELGSHLGPILVQLPPDLELDLPALEETLDAFPADLRVAVEPRHDSWFVDDVRRLLTDRGAALCVADRRGPITPLWRTADWAYLRFHAGRAMPRSCYAAGALETWAERGAATWGRDAGGFAFFNNDGNGCALRDASVFATAVEEVGVTVARAPVVPADVTRDPGRFVPDPEGRAPVAPGRAWGPSRARPGAARGSAAGGTGMKTATSGGRARCARPAR
jgi:uncharacterized protein YecE (DUF72 family)